MAENTPKRTTNPKQTNGDDTIMYCADDRNNDEDRRGDVNINHSSDTNNEKTNINLVTRQSNNSKNNETSTQHTAKQKK